VDSPRLHTIFTDRGEIEGAFKTSSVRRITMKRFLVLLSVFAVLSTGAFAAGQIEGGIEETPEWERGPRSFDLPEETTVLTGSLKLVLSGHPELEVAGQTWELLYPMHLAEGVEVEDGTSVTVEGYEVPGPRPWDADETEEKHLLVTKATIDGTEYDLSETIDRGFGPMAFAGQGPRGGFRGPGGSPCADGLPQPRRHPRGRGFSRGYDNRPSPRGEFAPGPGFPRGRR
jgi:hypothetical protein